ncbi:hypothetical protein [Calothrix sp. UHCC 0171]|uniref:hypothetical protein n=1 Tax=Calothrix sp. UHCC 0171 TaxID=3110245 RepID=UPI002B21D150|nr:hypothetical protein [Calothrix sp. UHCC 0171]MEA5572047.1 hypothetical protein [Calothrix sp. UHCC 0171]
MKIDFSNIDFSSVDTSSLETEEEFRQEAKRLLPAALLKVGEAVAENTWEELQKNLAKAGTKVKTSASEKRQFVRETIKNYQRSASSRERQELEDYIVEILRNS